MNLFYLCLKIFSARIIDVSMNTIRTVYIVKGKRLISTVIAFFEVLIWFEVARTALNTEINSFLIPISYAGGYATGTYIGTLISTKFIKGHYTVTIISNNIDSTKIKKIKKEGYGVTSIATETNSKYLIIEINLGGYTISMAENKISRKNTDDIKFEHVPSLAMIKYFNRFMTKEDTKERFEKYLADVRSGKKELKIATTTVYDIYRNRDKIDPDLFFDKIEKIKINAIPVVDTSISMCNSNDSIGKAYAIGHYIAKCSTYAPNKVVTFSSKPTLLTLGKENIFTDGCYCYRQKKQNLSHCKNQYEREIESMYTGDYSNTDFGKVMELLKDLDDMPEYLVVLSDMEFDEGSCQSKDELEKLWKDNGYTTKIVWWNLNERNITIPEMDSNGNIYLSGYSPMLLKFLEVGFDGTAFLNKLLEEYKKEIE